MRNPVITMIVLLLPLFSGCKDLGRLQLTEDRPEDIGQLLEHHEFVRAWQLTGKFPEIATPALHMSISTQEKAYEETISAEAHRLESANKLFAAVKLLSAALHKIPNSRTLREYRNRLEFKRIDRIRANERQQVIARAEYILNKRQYYRQQSSLQAPNPVQTREQARNDAESLTLSAQLLEYGKYAVEHDDINTARKCLKLSKNLDNNAKTSEILDRIPAAKNTQKKVTPQPARSIKAKKQNRARQRQILENNKLLEQARQALAENDIAAAREFLQRVSPPANRSKNALQLQEELDIAANKQVKELISRGDTEYRADDVLAAISTWSAALMLDPNNQPLIERLDRAGRVLAKLEQLRQIQGK